MSLLDLKAVLTLDSSQYERGLLAAGNAIRGGLTTMARAGAAAVGAATAAVSAFTAVSVRAGANFDQSMSQVAATMGLTMDEMANELGSVDLAWGQFSGNLRDYAQEMGRNTVFSASQAADALNYMALAGYDVQTSMEMLPNVLNLAAAGNFDLARASDMVTDTQTAFGISLERTSQMVDEMARAASTGNTSVEQLGDAFLTVGGLAQELNGGMVTLADGTQAPVDGLQELEIALVAMANAGVKGSEAGTHMRNMLLKLSSPTAAGVEQLEALGVAVFDTEGNMRSLSDIFSDLSGSMDELTQEEKLQAISDLFNTRDLASAEALLNAVGSDWDAIGESILSADGAAQQMAETQLDNLAGDITLFKSALEGAQIAISDKLTPSLRDFVQFGSNGLSTLTDAFKNGGVTGAMEAFGTILADGLNMIVSWLPEAIDAGMQLVGAVGKGLLNNLPAIITAGKTIVQSLIRGTIKALPALASGTAQIIGGIVSGIFELLPEIVSSATDLVKSFVSGMSAALPEIVSTASEIVSAILLGLQGVLPELLTGAVEIIVALAGFLAETAPELIPAAVDMILSLVDGLLDNVDALVDASIALITGLANGLVAAIPVLLEKAPIIISKLVEAIMNNVPKILTAAVELITSFAQGMWEQAPAAIGAMIDIMTSMIATIVQNFPEYVKNGLELIKKLAGGIMGGVSTVVFAVGSIVMTITEKIRTVITSALTWGRNIIQNLGNAISGAISFVSNAVTRIKDAITSGISGLASSALTWGKDLIDNFVSGITGGVERVANAARNVATSVRNLIGFSEPKEGPLSNFHTYAPDMIDLFVKGIKENTDRVKKQLAESFSMDDVHMETSVEQTVDSHDSDSDGGTRGTGGGIVINVYGAEGQDVDELSEVIMRKLSDKMLAEGAVWAA